MRKVFLIPALLISLCFSMPAKAQINIVLQPTWGPVGYDYVNYYYIPGIQSYYSVPLQQFTYFEEGQWINSPYPPPQYADFDLYHAYKFVVNEPNPWLRNEYYYGRYYVGYHDRIYDRPLIRESHDRRYMEGREERERRENSFHEGYHRNMEEHRGEAHRGEEHRGEEHRGEEHRGEEGRHEEAGRGEGRHEEAGHGEAAGRGGSGRPAPEAKSAGSGRPAPEAKSAGSGRPAPEAKSAGSGRPAPEAKSAGSGRPAAGAGTNQSSNKGVSGGPAKSAPGGAAGGSKPSAPAAKPSAPAAKPAAPAKSAAKPAAPAVKKR